MTRRRYTFACGPTLLPPEVLRQVQQDVLDWRGTGFSILEMSQWDPRLIEMFEAAEHDLRELLSVPEHYRVFFLHGGASNQFAMVPMNLLRGRRTADYVHTGLWSRKAIREARRYAEVGVAATAEPFEFSRVPRQDELRLDPSAAYAHYTVCDSAQGLEFPYIPNTGDVPLVADCSSSLFTHELPVDRHGLLYASAQKNAAATSLTIVIARDDLLGHADQRTPTTFDYGVHARTDSRFTTPPVFAWYLAGLMFAWVRAQGGVAAVAAAARRRADLLYRVLDGSGFYDSRVEPESRSPTVVPFFLADTRLEETFVKEAEEAGLEALRGHMSVGGLRAGLYAGMPTAGVEALTAFMTDFETRHG